MNRRSLPIGIQTFRKIREGDCYYVDKTGFALRLIAEGTPYFLSRPRRFGKSLFLDTLAELFSGNQALFQGLEAESRWDWSRRFPVIRLSFAEGVLRDRAELDEKIAEVLAEYEARLEVTSPHHSRSGRLHGLIGGAHARHGERVVVLEDEYDKPILDNISDPETARAMRDGLRDLYSVIKGQDAHIRFAFLIGISKFSKVSLFLGLNNRCRPWRAKRRPVVPGRRRRGRLAGVAEGRSPEAAEARCKRIRYAVKPFDVGPWRSPTAPLGARRDVAVARSGANRGTRVVAEHKAKGGLGSPVSHPEHGDTPIVGSNPFTSSGANSAASSASWWASRWRRWRGISLVTGSASGRSGLGAPWPGAGRRSGSGGIGPWGRRHGSRGGSCSRRPRRRRQ